ncbi:hypothetical protein [Actinokineospora sp. HUAS TT18]|uniref:hypothetical protein n=1 Tax=Actinokineospora sp. HUAS TT18 TaxID=3447451 RepID=UPI003F52290C
MTDNRRTAGKLPRLNANMTPATRDAIAQLAATEHISHTEALRRLVALGALLHRAHNDGGHVLIRHPHTDTLDRVIPI